MGAITKVYVVPFNLLVKATITHPLPEEIETMTLEKLKQTDVQLHAEARARYTFTAT